MAAEPAENQEPAPVSFTDANQETGMNQTGADPNGNGKSAMMDLIGELKNKKNKKSEEKATKSKEKSTESGSGKKKKKKNKKKTKKMRGTDRFESQNYLMRMEGSICCGALASFALYFLWNVTVLMVILYITCNEGSVQMDHIFNVKEEKK